MRSRLLTLVLLAAAAFFLYRFGVEEDLTAEPPPAGGALFPGLELLDIDFVSLKFRTGHVLDLEKIDGRWLITFPTDEVAQPEYVEALVRNIADAKVLPVEEQGGAIDPEAVGLGRGAKSIAVGAGEAKATLLVGDKNPLGTGVFAQLQGSPHVILVTENLLTMLESFRAEDYTDKHLWRGLPARVDSIRVERPEGVLLDAVREGDDWVLREPVAALADDGRVSMLVRSLRFCEYLMVAGVRPDDSLLAEVGLPNKHQIREGDYAGATMVALGASGMSPVRAFIQAGWQDQEAETFAVREDTHKLLVFDRKELNLLRNEPDFFRDRRVLPPVRERATAVRVEVDGERLLEIAKDERGGWSFLSPERLRGVRVDSERVDGHSLLTDFLGQLDELEVERFDDPPPDGAPAASIRIDWSWAGRERTDVLDLFDLMGPAVRARASARPTEGLVLDPGVLTLLAPDHADRLRWLAPVELDHDAWRGLEIHRPDQDEPYVLTREEGGSWEGDDLWGRRYGLAHDVLQLRGLGWRPVPDRPLPVATTPETEALLASMAARYPWRLVYLDAEGAPLGVLGLRGLGAGEARQERGRDVVAAFWSGVEGFELMVPADVLDRVAELDRPQ